MAKLLVVLSVVAATAIASCGFPVTRPVSQATYDSATLVGQVGALADDFQGEWWFEYTAGGSPVQRTPRQPISVAADALVPVSASVTGLEALGEPIPGFQRVRLASSRLCIQNATFGPYCSSRDQGFQTGDYISYNNGAFRAAPYLGDVTINAESGPEGEEPSGQVDIDYFSPESEPSIVGSVTCLAARGRFITLGVDNQQGPNALLELGTSFGGGQPIDNYLEIADPPADLSDCPEPDPVTVSGRLLSLIGAGPRIVDGP